MKRMGNGRGRMNLIYVGFKESLSEWNLSLDLKFETESAKEKEKSVSGRRKEHTWKHWGKKEFGIFWKLKEGGVDGKRWT